MMLVAKWDLMTTHGSGWKNAYYMVRTLASMIQGGGFL